MKSGLFTPKPPQKPKRNMLEEMSERLKLQKTTDTLTEEQKTIVKQIEDNSFRKQAIPHDMKEYKSFNAELYQALYPYLSLAYSFEQKGVIEEHTKKLACMFATVDQALKYLIAYSDKNKTNRQFVHDACLFSLPEPKNFPVWRKLATAKNKIESIESTELNLLSDDFRRLLSVSAKIDAQIKQDQKEKDTLELGVYKRHFPDDKEVKFPFTTEQYEKLEKKIIAEIKKKMNSVVTLLHMISSGRQRQKKRK